MRIKQAGKIKEGFYALGHPAVPVYLLDISPPVLFDAGFTAFSSLYAREIRSVLGQHPPVHLFLTHSHWDHVGAASHFRSLWPRLKIAASEEFQKILSRPGAVQQIRQFNRQACSAVRDWGVQEIYPGDFEPFPCDRTVRNGQPIRTGADVTIEPIHTPGHTWDFMSYWIPETKILIASDAAGCDGVCEFLVDEAAYAASLDRMLELDVDILCVGHNLVLTGKDARRHLRTSREQVPAYVRMVRRFLREEQEDIDRVATRVKAAEWDKKALPKQPEQAYMMNTKVRVRTILRHMKAAA